MARRTAETAGAGLAGLTLATRLAQLGWDVRLHERNPELRMFGAGLWLWESGLRTLEQLGAFAQATALARTIPMGAASPATPR
jgi:2-polyprenyl-6-methoxyphenol hydroxylase-like FAD-dependent oxidoreductase